MTDDVLDGRLLWSPPADNSGTQVGRYMQWLADNKGLHFHDHQGLWTWSTTEIEAFWGSLWEYFEVQASAPYDTVLVERRMPGAQWFPGARLNYAEHIVGGSFPDDAVAIVARSNTRGPMSVTFGELTEQVARARVGLQRLGVGRGDRVAAYLPNIPETLVAFLACCSLGAVWASCAAEFGERSVIDRFVQIEPKVLLAVSGYTYGQKHVDRRREVAVIAAALPSVEHLVHVPYGPDDLEGSVPWSSIVAEDQPLEFEQVPFDHPLYVLFSSGTTGLPKAITHGHGGILIEHQKNHILSWDLGPADRLMWFTTTAWMMWNALVSTLLAGASIVMLDGNPLYPDLHEQWRLAEETQATVLGLSPAYLMNCRKAGIQPTRQHDLSRLRQICSAGSPLPPEAAVWIFEQFGDEVLLNNGSGGTDVCTGIVQGNPLVPVWAGEISAGCLGVAAVCFDENGNTVVGELGELVITQPMPSMPVGYWNDPDGERYRSTYFDMYPGVWRQADWIRFSDRGSCVITGRSDATLNRGGVRLGTGEFYRVVEEHPAVADSLVIHLEDDQGGVGELMLFVVLTPGTELDAALRTEIVGQLKTQLSPRHVPDAVVQMPVIPRNLTGKKLELPVKKILRGASIESVASRGSLADPESLDPYAAFAATRA
ncbi:MAG: acetoacetyl-CoA synthase [Ilumatobacteraceae bacterium]|nr:acetoacetyl-CoA synthase [Ilumatobacteraceae bacterium]